MRPIPDRLCTRIVAAGRCTWVRMRIQTNTFLLRLLAKVPWMAHKILVSRQDMTRKDGMRT